MPSVKLELGKYVTLRGPRKDGTHRVFFQVPARLAPSGWLPLIPLPINGARKGDLNDADEVLRIQEDAAALYVKLLAARNPSTEIEPSARSIPTLNRLWQVTQAFKKNKPRTQRNYAKAASLIEAWSASVNHPPVASMRGDKVEAFLALYDDRPTTKKQILTVLKLLMAYAVKLGWRADNPAADIKVRIPKSRVAIWELEDVELYAKACIDGGRPSLAAMIWTQWEIGQRLTDVCLFRYGGQYSDNEGLFSFQQSKTEAKVSIPISERLGALLRACRVTETLYLFINEATGGPWVEKELSQAFAYIRDTRIVDKGGPHRQLRVLRHSCVVQLARAGCTVAEIAAITGHSLSSVTTILSHYLPRDSQVARNAQTKRGLIKKADSVAETSTS